MSRVGKNPVAIPAGVTVELSDKAIKAKGKLGELKLDLTSDVVVSQEGDNLFVKPAANANAKRAMWATTQRNVNNLVVGVSAGFEKKLEINGIGFRAQVQGKELIMQLGFSHDVRFNIPEGITITVEKNTLLTINGADKQRVGQVAAEIRAFREPEPYKGKGIKYADERIVRKEGKKK